MDYHTPHDLNTALHLLAGGDVSVIAGGTDVFPAMPQGGPQRPLLDITRIDGLRGITRADDGWRIGAATTWSDIAGADLPGAFDGLRAAAREVGARQIQNAGTIAGNLCNASPAADGVPPLLTLGAEVEVQSHAGTRQMPLAAFLLGVRKTALQAGELLTAVHIPTQPYGAVSAFEKLGSRRYLVISIAMVSVVLTCDDAGLITHARVAVGACSPIAQCLPDLEAALVGQHPARVQIEAAHLAALSPIDDVRASAGYRREAVETLIARAVARAGGGNG